MKFFEWSCWVGLFAVGVLAVAGCGGPKSTGTSDGGKTKKENVTLQVLLIDAPSIAGTAGRRWAAEGLGETEFSQMTLKDLADADFQLSPDVDVIIYPAEVMADLVSRSQLVPIPKRYLDGELANRKELLPHQQKYLLYYGSEVYTLPLGDVYLTLVYNQKIFEELDLSVPETWAEYANVAAKLREAGHQVQEPFAEGWASRLLLNRAAAYVRTRGNVSTVLDIKTTQPLINSAPFERAMDELKTALGNSIDTTLSPADVFSNLLNGKAAMGLTWPSKHFGSEQDPMNEDLSIARMPGSADWFDPQESNWGQRYEDVSTRMELMGCSGLVASVNNGGADAALAIEFASWICSKSTSTRVSVECPQVSLFRATHLGQPMKWTGDKISPAAADQFAQVLRDVSESNIAFLFPRIPGQAEYLRSLDQAVIAFAKGEESKQEALEIVVGEWNSITEKLGKKEQNEYLRRSEGFGR